MYDATEVKTKAAVSVAEMARMVGLTRARFYQLGRDDLPLATLRRRQSPTLLQRAVAGGLPRRSAAELRRRWQARAVLCPATAGRAGAGAEAEEGRRPATSTPTCSTG